MRHEKEHLPQFQPDFIISWDHSGKDAPCLVVSRLRKDGARVVADVIGHTFAASGCISLRQVLEEFEKREREEAERAKRLGEGLKKAADAFAKYAGPAAEALNKVADAANTATEKPNEEGHP